MNCKVLAQALSDRVGTLHIDLFVEFIVAKKSVITVSHISLSDSWYYFLQLCISQMHVNS